MKRTWLALFLAVVMLLSALPLTAFATDEEILLLEGDTIVYTKTPNGDGTYTITVSDPTGDGRLPNLVNDYVNLPWHLTSDVSTVIFDETITHLGTRTVCFTKTTENVKDIHFLAKNLTYDANAVVDYSNAPGRQATVHSYASFAYKVDTAKFAGNSYYEAEDYEDKYADLWAMKNADAAKEPDLARAAIAEFATLPARAQEQLAARKTKLDAIQAILDGETPEYDDSKLLFDDDTITVDKQLNTDGVTYTVTISDPMGDGVLPTKISDVYADMPWHDYDVTTVIFDETITRLVTLTIRLTNSHKIKEIHFKNPDIKTTANCVVDYSNAPGRQATVYAYSTWSFALSDKFAGIVYYEAKEFIDTYAALWSLSTVDATFYEEEIAAAVAAYPQIPEIARMQLSSQKSKLDELADAIGLEMPETNENLLLENDTVLFNKTLNEDGETYTVTVSDPMGDGVLPNISSITTSMPWHAADVTTVIFDETIVGLSAQTIYLTNSSTLKHVYLLAPYVSVPVNGIVDYSNDPGRQATVYAYGTFTYQLSNKFAGVSYFETMDYLVEHGATLALNASDAVANRAKIAAAIADYMILPATVQATMSSAKATLDTLGAALGLSGSQGGISYLVDDINHILQITGSGSLAYIPAWDSIKSTIETVTVSDGITEIKAGTFSGFTTLKSIDLPFSIAKIEAGAFPTTVFEMHGWLNHPIGDYAALNANVSLKLKELRIFSIGNSHTLNYTSYFADIIKDLQAGLDTKLIHERIVTGSRRLYYRDAETMAASGNHYDAAHNDDSFGYAYDDVTDSPRYATAFAKTWDIVIVQDYHESTWYGAEFAEGMPTVMKWLREEAEGAQIVWFADWVENFASQKASYANGLAAVNAVEALPEGDKPDYIIVVSTIIENARNTYFGTSKNPVGVIPGSQGSEKLPILESDAAHMSYELGQYMLGCSVMYQLLEEFRDVLPVDDSFDYFALLKTDPVHPDWTGEFVPEYRDVIKEIAVNSYKERFAETASNYTVDPAIAKHEALLEILEGVAVPKSATAGELNVLYKSGAVVEAICALGFNVKAGDISVTFDETNGNYTVFVNCRYGESASEGVTYTSSVSTAATAVAKVGSTTYTTLKEAIAAAATGGEPVVLLDHAVVTETLAFEGGDLTVDLGGFEISATTAVFSVTGGHALTLKNGTVKTYGSKSYVVSSNESGAIALENVTLTAYDSRVIYHTSVEHSTDVSIKNSTLTAKNAVAVYIAAKDTASDLNTLLIDGSAITGKSAVDAKLTDVTVKKGSTLTATVIGDMLTGFKKNGAAGYAIALSNNQDATVGSITISGGSFYGLIGIEDAYEEAVNDVTVAISGGTFNAPVPADFCAEGYTPKDNGNGTYGVYSENEPSATLDASIISHQVSKVKNGSFSLRAIAGVNSLNYKRFGYEVTVTTADGVQTLSGTSTTAYTAIRIGETLYTIRDHFDYEYACLATITGLAADSASTTIEIRAYVVDSNNTKLYGESVTLVYNGTQDAGYPVISIAE